MMKRTHEGTEANFRCLAAPLRSSLQEPLIVVGAALVTLRDFRRDSLDSPSPSSSSSGWLMWYLGGNNAAHCAIFRLSSRSYALTGIAG